MALRTVAFFVLMWASNLIICVSSSGETEAVPAPELLRPDRREALPPVATLSETLISMLFSRKSWSGDPNGKGGFVSALWKAAGVGGDNFEAFALSAIISLLRLTSKVLTSDEESSRTTRALDDFSPVSYLLNRPQVSRLWSLMQDPEIVDSLLEEVGDKLTKRDSAEDAECIRLLVCKTSPFVRGMQKAVKFFMKKEGKNESFEHAGEPGKGTGKRGRRLEHVAWEKSSPEDRMYYFVPALEDVAERGRKCDARFPKCLF